MAIVGRLFPGSNKASLHLIFASFTAVAVANSYSAQHRPALGTNQPEALIAAFPSSGGRRGKHASSAQSHPVECRGRHHTTYVYVYYLTPRRSVCEIRSVFAAQHRNKQKALGSRG
jgi:hypothetical protein